MVPARRAEPSTTGEHASATAARSGANRLPPSEAAVRAVPTTTAPPASAGSTRTGPEQTGSRTVQQGSERPPLPVRAGEDVRDGDVGGHEDVVRTLRSSWR